MNQMKNDDKKTDEFMYLDMTALDENSSRPKAEPQSWMRFDQSMPSVDTFGQTRETLREESLFKAKLLAVPAPRQLKTRLVLVIDDETFIQHVVARILKAKGYQVLTAGDGPEAITLFEKHRDEIDLVLLDHSLPGFSGLDLLRLIRGDSPELPVIYTSGYGLADIKLTVSEHTAFLQKPFALKALMEAVTGMLARGEVKN